MTSFSKSTFSAVSYATFRPSYPPSLYQTVLSYHKGSRNLCVDLGCGHGLIARALAPEFTKLIGTDPSKGMVRHARSSTSENEFPNVTFEVASAESIPFLESKSVDMVVAGQAAHWFEYPKLFAELRRIMRPGGTLAFWGYKDHQFPGYPKASKLINQYGYGNEKHLMGPYWQQPGRSIVVNKLRAVQPPVDEWDEITRIEYEPGLDGPKTGGPGPCFMNVKMTLEQNMDYIRTWSSYHGWREAHPDQKPRSQGGTGDVVDDMFDEMLENEEDWQKEGDAWKEKVVEVEWGTGILLARKK